MINELLQIGFLTGSRAFGLAKDDSDYDIGYSIHDTQTVNRMIGDLEREGSAYFGGFSVVDPSTKQKVNLIPLHPVEVMPWWLATQALKSVVAAASDELKALNKVERHAVFMGIICLFKAVLPCHSQLSSYKEVNAKARGGLAIESTVPADEDIPY